MLNHNIIGRLRLVRDLFMTPLEVLRPIPAVAWIPLAILMFASPEGSMIFITFVGAFFPILLSTIHGVSVIDRRLIFAAMTLVLHRSRYFAKLFCRVIRVEVAGLLDRPRTADMLASPDFMAIKRKCMQTLRPVSSLVGE